MSAEPTALMEYHEKSRIRTAAFRAKKIYPGPVGELISQELLDWEYFGYRFDRYGLVGRLVEHLMIAPLPEVAAA